MSCLILYFRTVNFFKTKKSNQGVRKELKGKAEESVSGTEFIR